MDRRTTYSPWQEQLLERATSWRKKAKQCQGWLPALERRGSQTGHCHQRGEGPNPSVLSASGLLRPPPFLSPEDNQRDVSCKKTTLEVQAGCRTGPWSDQTLQYPVPSRELHDLAQDKAPVSLPRLCTKEAAWPAPSPWTMPGTDRAPGTEVARAEAQ
ncbi:uncharacterized protein J5F26_002596 isoform 2-T5 [Ciconia maguari]